MLICQLMGEEEVVDQELVVEGEEVVVEREVQVLEWEEVELEEVGQVLD